MGLFGSFVLVQELGKLPPVLLLPTMGEISLRGSLLALVGVSLGTEGCR